MPSLFLVFVGCCSKHIVKIVGFGSVVLACNYLLYHVLIVCIGQVMMFLLVKVKDSDLVLYFMCIDLLYACVSVYHMYGDPGRSDPLELKLMDSCEPPSWEPNRFFRKSSQNF